MKTNPLKDKSFFFAVQIVNTTREIQKRKKEFILSNQLMRSGTAIGALYREAEQAESRADFIHKLAIAQKECNESLYWLELLEQTNFLEKDQYEKLEPLCRELIRLLTSIIRSTKQSIRRASAKHLT